MEADTLWDLPLLNPRLLRDIFMFLVYGCFHVVNRRVHYFVLLSEIGERARHRLAALHFHSSLLLGPLVREASRIYVSSGHCRDNLIAPVLGSCAAVHNKLKAKLEE